MTKEQGDKMFDMIKQIDDKKSKLTMANLNDNEVREVAKMQRLITKYENVINALFLKAKCNVDIKLLKTEDSDLDGNIVFLYKWIKEKKEEE